MSRTAAPSFSFPAFIAALRSAGARILFRAKDGARPRTDAGDSARMPARAVPGVAQSPPAVIRFGPLDARDLRDSSSHTHARRARTVANPPRSGARAFESSPSSLRGSVASSLRHCIFCGAAAHPNRSGIYVIGNDLAHDECYARACEIRDSKSEAQNEELALRSSDFDLFDLAEPGPTPARALAAAVGE